MSVTPGARAASIVQYGYFVGGGRGSDAAGLAAFGSFLFPTIGRFLLPLVALVLLLLTSEVNGTVVLAGALSLAVTAFAGIAGYLFLRGERSARWIGAMTQRPLSWILVKVKHDPIDDSAAKAADLRTQALAVLREGWALGSIGVAANLFVTYLILLASLRFVGVSSAELSAPDAFAAFAIAFWAGAVFPITGSGLGVVDAVLIAMLIELSSASDDTLVAAALLWRVFYSVLTLPLGAITLGRFRKANPESVATYDGAAAIGMGPDTLCDALASRYPFLPHGRRSGSRRTFSLAQSPPRLFHERRVEWLGPRPIRITQVTFHSR